MQTVIILKTAEQAVFPTQKQVLHAQDCRQTRSGTPLQALPKLGTAVLGLRRQQAVSTTLQVQANADTNVRQIILGQIQSAKQIPRFPTARDFPQTRYGTLLQQFRRRGTARAGNRQQQVLTTLRQVQANADTNVTVHTTGTIQHAQIRAILHLAILSQIPTKYALLHRGAIIPAVATDIIHGLVQPVHLFLPGVKQARLHADFQQQFGLPSLPTL